jgi:hypothetical protein
MANGWTANVSDTSTITPGDWTGDLSSGLPGVQPNPTMPRYDFRMVATSGFHIRDSRASSAWRGQVKYSGTRPLYYWIGRWRDGSDMAMAPGDWLYRIDFVSDGWLIPEAGVACFEVPFVSGLPYPVAQISNSPVLIDANFIMFGDIPDGFLGDHFVPTPPPPDN